MKLWNQGTESTEIHTVYLLFRRCTSDKCMLVFLCLKKTWHDFTLIYFCYTLFLILIQCKLAKINHWEWVTRTDINANYCRKMWTRSHIIFNQCSNISCILCNWQTNLIHNNNKSIIILFLQQMSLRITKEKYLFPWRSFADKWFTPEQDSCRLSLRPPSPGEPFQRGVIIT